MCNYRSNPKRRRGFTLIELLAVVAIIALLIGILVPAVSSVRTNARTTATRATFAAMDTGIATFKGSAELGGSTPPSASDADSTSVVGKRNVKNPYLASFPDQKFSITGTGLLVWALAGADMLGSPGFRPFRPVSSFWADDTDNNYVANNADQSGAYALNDKNQVVHPRSGPFVDLSKVRVTQLATVDGKQSFDVPADTEARRTLGVSPVQRKYPMFLDAFGFPILYWKADLAGVQFADNQDPETVKPARRGIYHWLDNRELHEGNLAGNSSVLVLQPTSEAKSISVHFLNWSNLQQPPGLGKPKKLFEEKTFQRYIDDAKIPSKNYPYNPDSYMLVSPGPDGVYGSKDDIANFEHNGQY